MMDLTPKEYFQNARRAGIKEYTSRVSNGQMGYLPSLEGILKDTEIVSQIDLGLLEIPLKKIAGTNSYLRSICFSNNFMPLMDERSEFNTKWISLCEAHIKEGIRDPIKVYEYLNWYYVIEGNKRVSVLKYFNAYSVHAYVTRLIPKFNPENHEIQIYYEFLKFNKVTKINSIWFSRKKSFDKLLSLLVKYNPPLHEGEDKFKYFEVYIYNTFRRIYFDMGGDKLPITTGDAFLEYAAVYGIPDKIDEELLRKTMKEIIKELKFFKNDRAVDIQAFPAESSSSGGLHTPLSILLHPQKILKVAFVYARNIETSGWTYGHELGRVYLKQALNGQVTTSFIDNVPEDEKAYPSIKALADEGYDVIFTTSPVFRNAALRCALEYPEIRFFNCSEYRPYKHLSNYFGRTYEPRFLTGIIAGAMTKTNIIGYAATLPTPEVISCINSFALGAKMVNPYSKVKIAWTREWNSHEKFTDADEKLINGGADIISNRNLSVPRDVTKKYGVYSMLVDIDPETKQPVHYLAAPVWNWGVFYEKIVRDILNGTYGTINDIFNNSKLVNFWWGMASGVIDIYFSKTHVPSETAKLVLLMKSLISNSGYHPFIGPIFDNTGNLRIEEDTTASLNDILKMNWFVENVEAEQYIKGTR